MSFQELSAELTGVLPGLSPFLADSYINRAWRDIRDERNWSFLVTEGAIVCPTQVTAGSVSFTQYASTVTCDAEASAALLALGSTPGLTNMQIRFGSQGIGDSGPLYQITAVNDDDPTAIVLVLDRMITSPTDADSTYQVYRALVTPPSDDFKSFMSVVDFSNAISMTSENGRLDKTSVYFDMRDPQRMAQGLAYYVGAFHGSPEDQSRPVYELWPHPTSGQTFYVRYRRKGLDFSQPTDTQPVGIPDALILDRAYGWYAYPWAAANVGHFPNLRGVGYVQGTIDRKANYKEGLIRAFKEDNETQLSTIWNRGHGLLKWQSGGVRGMWDYPIDANFLQSHLVNF